MHDFWGCSWDSTARQLRCVGCTMCPRCCPKMYVLEGRSICNGGFSAKILTKLCLWWTAIPLAALFCICNWNHVPWEQMPVTIIILDTTVYMTSQASSCKIQMDLGNVLCPSSFHFPPNRQGKRFFSLKTPFFRGGWKPAFFNPETSFPDSVDSNPCNRQVDSQDY